MVRPIRSEEEITRLTKDDAWMMQVLGAAEKLDLPDWWIGAGFLRNKVWNYMEGNDSEQTRDVDLVYFNGQDVTPETDWAYDEKMRAEHPFAEWEVRNQARMHYKNGLEPFTSTADGIAHWTETATSVAVRLQKGTLEYLFCYGTGDLFDLIARPTPHCKTEAMLNIFRQRVAEKRWKEKWPDLRVITE